MEMMPRRWIAIYFATLCVVRAHHHGGHPIIPIPFPYSAGSYKHTSSVVNVPVHQERLIIIKKPGNHHHHHGHAHGHKHGHAHSHGHDHDHHHSLAVNHGYNEQESRILSDFSDMRPVVNNYHIAHSHQYPYFEDLSYLLDPMFLQQSVWLDQFPDVL